MPLPRQNVSSGSEFEAAVGYSRAVRVGPHVAVAGTTGSGDNVAAQARDALRRIEIALTQAGAALTDVVRTRIYITDIDRWREVGDVHAEVEGDPFDGPVAMRLAVGGSWSTVGRTRLG